MTELEGFLGPDIDKIAALVEAEHPQHMALVARVNRLGRSLLVGRTVSLQRTADKVAVALFARTSQSFQGACLLAARGMRADSRALARSAFESAAYCLAACRDYKGKDGVPLVRLIYAEHERFRAKAIEEILSRPQTLEEVRTVLGEAKAEIENVRDVPKINLQQLMVEIGIASSYTNFYRSLSQDAHVSAVSLGHHMDVDESGDFNGFLLAPDYTQFGHTVAVASLAVLLAADAFIDRFEFASMRTELCESFGQCKPLLEENSLENESVGGAIS